MYCRNCAPYDEVWEWIPFLPFATASLSYQASKSKKNRDRKKCGVLEQKTHYVLHKRFAAK